MASAHSGESRRVLDLTRDLAEAARVAASAEQVDALLGEAVDTLGKLVPFDLATVMELRGEELRVRIARGEMAGPQVLAHRLSLEQFGSIRELLRSGRARAFTEVDHRDGDGDAFDGVLDLPHGHYCMVVPLRLQDEALGIMTFDRGQCGAYPEAVVELADVFGRLLAIALSYGAQSQLLERLHGQTLEQNRLLAEQVAPSDTDACRLMEASRSDRMVAIMARAKQVAASDTPVLLTGETGSGKEVLAHAIHAWSARRGRPLVSLNAAALPAALIESELFGHVKGAFTGATTGRMGRFQTANGSTLLLDEIGEMPLELQAKLLRVLQQGCFEPVGSDRTVRVDVRLIAATNADLLQAVAEGRFRKDLYYRLAVFPLEVPPLRERREDILPIAENLLAALSRRRSLGALRLSQAARAWLVSRPWPGNVRELAGVLERAVILEPGPDLELAYDGGRSTGAGAALEDRSICDLPTTEAPATAGQPLLTLEAMERQHIAAALRTTQGRIHGASGAAELLGIHPSTLRSRMKKLGIEGARRRS